MKHTKHMPGPTCILIDSLVHGSTMGEIRTPCTEHQAEMLPKLLLKIAIKLKNGQFNAAISLIERAKARGES